MYLPATFNCAWKAISDHKHSFQKSMLSVNSRFWAVILNFLSLRTLFREAREDYSLKNGNSRSSKSSKRPARQMIFAAYVRIGKTIFWVPTDIVSLWNGAVVQHSDYLRSVCQIEYFLLNYTQSRNTVKATKPAQAPCFEIAKQCYSWCTVKSPRFQSCPYTWRRKYCRDTASFLLHVCCQSFGAVKYSTQRASLNCSFSCEM